jgi:hypothetical protein
MCYLTTANLNSVQADIGDEQRAVTAFELTFKTTLAIGQRGVDMGRDVFARGLLVRLQGRREVVKATPQHYLGAGQAKHPEGGLIAIEQTVMVEKYHGIGGALPDRNVLAVYCW